MKPTTPLTFKHQLTFATRPKRGRWLFLALLLPSIGGVMAYTTSQVTQAPESVALSAAAIPAVPVLAATPAEPVGSKVDVVVRRNDTIEGIFRQLKLSAADLSTVLNVPGVGASFTQLQPGDKLTVVHDRGVLNAINRHISETEVVAVTRGESGFVAERIVTLE